MVRHTYSNQIYNIQSPLETTLVTDSNKHGKIERQIHQRVCSGRDTINENSPRHANPTPEDMLK